MKTHSYGMHKSCTTVVLTITSSDSLASGRGTVTYLKPLNLAVTPIRLDHRVL